MMPQIKIELTAEAQETLRVVQTLPQNILLGIAAAMDKQNLFTVSAIQRDYLSFPKGEPSTPVGLRVQTGRGRSSVRSSKAVINGQQVESAIGSNVGYMAVHEFGATIPAHDVVAKGGALRFKIGDRVIFAKKVHIPEIELPARAPIQNGIANRVDDYSNAISAEIQKVWEGK